MRLVLVLFTPLLVAPFVLAMATASRSFQQNYSETLCRMESVRTHAIANIENNETIEANFGRDECLTPMLPTIDVTILEATPTLVPPLEAAP